ncbi:cytochrome c [Pusillimonas sp. ANT_WB101]|uniref:c-type cytochrome n=1 Tax=Pusillimonas sp. ANT_WB101 TaxID=2597356 RepID=UPI0011EF6CF3|nr:cytochrome c [Pusillimonas sp. ANT_WB101]KAA0911862.1 cytochrome c [Pusillimonas sp. ANT_WB101]
MKKSIALFAIATVVGLGCSTASAQFKDADAAIDYREAAMTLMGSHFGRMGPVAKKEAPFDAEAIRANVAIFSTIAALPWVAYGPGTEGGAAKPSVWSDAKGFKQKQDDFKVAVTKLDAAAEKGDFDAFRVAFGAVGKSCKACHDSYREKD